MFVTYPFLYKPSVKVLNYPHPILKHKCKPVTKIDKELRDMIPEMFKIMYETDGVGLAANQVGLPFQLFVMNASGEPEKTEEEHVFINPVIMKRSGKIEDSEGCLSFPGVTAEVLRAETIFFEAITLSGDTVQFEWKGHPARVVQHETDHLHGVGFVDRLTPTALLEIQKELDDMLTVFQGDRRVGFIPSDEEIARQIDEMEKRYCAS